MTFPSRKAAMTAHPDKGGSEAKMAQVNEAYEVLSKPGKRRYPINTFVLLAQLVLQNYVSASTTGMTQTTQTLKEALHLPDMGVRLVASVVEIIHLRNFSSKPGSADFRLVEAIDF
jgi:hypothetical protein